MKNRSERMKNSVKRVSLLLLSAMVAIPSFAEPEKVADAASSSNMTYILIGTALFQMVFIMIAAGIMQNLSRSVDVWSKFKKGGGRAGSLLALFAIPSIGFASGVDTPFLLMKTNDLFWLLIFVNMILFMIVVIMLGIIRGMIRNMRDDTVVEEVIVEEPDFLTTMTQSLTKAVDIDHEEDVLMDHEYDGIQELDNVLPPWWLWMFYATIVFAVVYLFGYHVFSVWPLSEEEYAIEMEDGRAQVAAYQATLTDRVDENTVVLMTEESALANGEKLYTELCVACHGVNGEGGIGPNFTDEFWLHGCDIKSVFSTVKYGVPEKGMISWKTQMKPPEMQNVSSYILSKFQTGTPVAGGKDPQGDACTAVAGEGSDNTGDDGAAPADTTVTNDTLTTAMLR